MFKLSPLCYPRAMFLKLKKTKTIYAKWYGTFWCCLNAIWINCCLNFYPSLVFVSLLHKKKNTQIVNLSCANQNHVKVSYCNMQNHVPCTHFEQGLERGSLEIPSSLNYSAILCNWIFLALKP